jgi:hypothetical protein
MYLRMLAGVGVVLALAVCLLSINNFGSAADDDPEVKAKAGTELILKLADAIEKGDAEAKKKAVADIKKMFPNPEDDLFYIMIPLKKRDAKTQPGLGFGPKGVYPPEQDGIEAKIIGLAKKKLTEDEAKKQGNDIKKAAAVTLAIAELTPDYCPVKKKEDKKDPKEWAQWAKDMKDGAAELVKVANSGNPDMIKAAATKLNNSCTECHGSPFRFGVCP